MSESAQTSQLIEHLLKIVEAITLELKDHKLLMSANDKTLALVDQRLRIAESMLDRVEKMQSAERVTAAGRVGGEKIKWAIISIHRWRISYSDPQVGSRSNTLIIIKTNNKQREHNHYGY